MRERKEAGGYWHTTPLHYVPYLLASRCLFAQAEIKARGLPIAARRTAERRDRKLGLDGFVHLSLSSETPLLRDKLRKGFPHVLLAFEEAVAELPGAGLCRFNAKAWAHRELFTPVTEAGERAELMAAWRSGRYPSLELLIPKELPLIPHARALHVATETDAAYLRGFQAIPGLLTISLQISPERFPVACEYDTTPFALYAAECLTAGTVLPPPDFPFD